MPLVKHLAIWLPFDKKFKNLPGPIINNAGWLSHRHFDISNQEQNNFSIKSVNTKDPFSFKITKLKIKG